MKSAEALSTRAPIAVTFLLRLSFIIAFSNAAHAHTHAHDTEQKLRIDSLRERVRERARSFFSYAPNEPLHDWIRTRQDLVRCRARADATFVKQCDAVPYIKRRVQVVCDDNAG